MNPDYYNWEVFVEEEENPLNQPVDVPEEGEPSEKETSKKKKGAKDNKPKHICIIPNICK